MIESDVGSTPSQGILPVLSTPPDRPTVVATTGTNGKTSTTGFVRQLSVALAVPTGTYTSHGVTLPDGTVRPISRGTTTTLLPRLLAEQAAAGARRVALEAFAAALAIGIYEPVAVDVAIVTGITPDHLDIHRTFERYTEAKLRLVREHVRPDGAVIVPTDGPQRAAVEQAAAARDLPCVAVGTGGRVDLRHRRPDGAGMTATLTIDGDAVGEARLAFADEPFVTNLLLAATAVLCLGAGPTDVASALACAALPPGRLEHVGTHDGATVVADAGHNPDALRRALLALRARPHRRLIVVFGCGGDRDRTKRQAMGEVAASLADVVIITDDNPRHERPDAIRSAIRSGCPDGIEIPLRRDAIIAALAMARPGDIVLLAGRGDETTQTIGSTTVLSDDRTVARAVMASAEMASTVAAQPSA